MTLLSLPLVSRLSRRPVRRGGFWSRLAAIAGLRRQRAHLAALDDHLLDDIGVTRHEALQEAARPGWDAPSHWRS